MLARKYRLRRAGDFNKVYKFGRSFGAKDLFIKAAKTNYDFSRLAVVVSKKVSKKAVVRNKIKRQCSEIMRKEWRAVKPGYNIVVTVKQDISRQKETVVRQQLVKCLERLGVWKSPN